MARIIAVLAAILALAWPSQAAPVPDHNVPGTISAGLGLGLNPGGYGGYGNFGPSSSWESNYQNSLAEIQEAYDGMNNMFNNGEAVPAGQQQGTALNPLTPFNPYTSPEGQLQPPGTIPEGGNPYVNPYANAYNAYTASLYGAYGRPPSYNPPSGIIPSNGESAQQSNHPILPDGMTFDQQLPEIQEDCWKNITDRINGFFVDRFPTQANGQSSFTNIEILSCYGCWCNRDERFGNGMGEPRDAFDAICKFHHQAYECIEIDAEERGEVCDPVSTSHEGFRFKMDLSFDRGRGGMNLQCDETQSWCKQRVCEADLQYIKDFVRTALAGHQVRRDLFGHEDHLGSDGLPTGYFDQRLECPLGGSLHTPHKKCCGAYPRRRVFKTDILENNTSSYRQCCDLESGDNTGATDGAVYYPASQICCNEQGVQAGDTCELYNAL